MKVARPLPFDCPLCLEQPSPTLFCFSPSSALNSNLASRLISSLRPLVIWMWFAYRPIDHTFSPCTLAVSPIPLSRSCPLSNFMNLDVVEGETGSSLMVFQISSRLGMMAGPDITYPNIRFSAMGHLELIWGRKVIQQPW